MIYVDKSDVGIWCRDPLCLKSRACKDPLACTQLAMMILDGLRYRQQQEARHKGSRK